MRKDFWAMLFVAAIFGALRFVVPVEGKIEKADIFKDLAHIAVGFMFGYAAYAKTRWQLWAIALGLTVLEIVAFKVRKSENQSSASQPRAALVCECGVACDCCDGGKTCACAEKSVRWVATKGCRCGGNCDCTPLDDICGCRAGPAIVFQRQIE